MSVTGYNVSVVDEPSGLTVVIVMASSVSIGKLVIGDVSVEEESVKTWLKRTNCCQGAVVVTVAVSEVVLIMVVVSCGCTGTDQVVVVGWK